ncbi:MAG: hypothetical protein QX199_13720 [Methylococcaceae bacterium]
MKILITLLAAALLSSQAIADRVVKCQVNTYQGSCAFSPDTPKGSFSLANPDKDKPLTEDISMVSVTVIEPGVAEVSGLTAEGINSRWGEAKRSSKDKACWEGEDFKVCAW